MAAKIKVEVEQHTGSPEDPRAAGVCYLVKRLTGALTPRVGHFISEDEAKDLIDAGVELVIKGKGDK